MKNVICDMCGLEMKLQKYQKTTKERHFRIRRFECICGYTKAIYAGGTRDEEFEPMIVIEKVEKMYKQQENNN